MTFLCKMCFIVMIGNLCSQCKEDYGISFDLRRCVKKDNCGALGVAIFLITCEKLVVESNFYSYTFSIYYYVPHNYSCV